MKIAFLIPSYNDDFRGLIVKIRKDFPNAIIVVISDGGRSFEFADNSVMYVRNENNQGLALTLLQGYKILSKLQFDYWVRLDADNEYPLEAVLPAINILSDSKIGGVIVSVCRTVGNVGLFDYLFHRLMGIIEGVIITGYPWIQHSPGMQIYRNGGIKFVIDIVRKEILVTKNKWGIDLVVIKAMTRMGRIKEYRCVNKTLFERRSFRKIYSQFVQMIKLVPVLLAN